MKRSLSFLVSAVLLQATVAILPASIVALGDGMQNTTAPVDDFGFANVGKVYDTRETVFTSGVYLGSGWVLTAYHAVRDVPETGFLFGDVIFGGSTYIVNAASAVRLQNQDTSPTDLALFQLTSNPSLPAVTISATTPIAASSLVMMGNGVNRDPLEIHWDVDTAPNPDQWTETAGAGDRQGYKWGSGQSLRWGTNELEGVDLIDAGYGEVSTIYTDFDNVADQAHGAAYDSGGGVFYKRGSTWELAGIVITVGGFSGQPLNTAVFGNETFAADLATYHDQIVTVIPEPSGGVLSLLGLGGLAGSRFHRKKV